MSKYITAEVTKSGLLTIRSKNSGAILGQLIRESDGFYYFLLPQDRTGIWPGYILREIADKIDDLNQGWEEKIEQDLYKGKKQ